MSIGSFEEQDVEHRRSHVRALEVWLKGFLY